MKTLLTVVEQVFHQTPNGPPTSVVSRYAVSSEDPEQVYARNVVLDTQGGWRPLDVGWFRGRSASLLLLGNIEGINLTQIPTVEERATLGQRIVEVAFAQGNGDSLLPNIPVLPGESCRLRPGDLSRIYVRCPNGPARITLTLFP